MLGSGTIHLRVVILQAGDNFFTAGLYCKCLGSSKTTVLYEINGNLSVQISSPKCAKNKNDTYIKIWYFSQKVVYNDELYRLVGWVWAENSSAPSLEGWSEQVFGFSSSLCPGTCRIRITLFFHRQRCSRCRGRKSTKIHN